MKKIILSTVLLTLGLSSVHAASLEDLTKDALINTSDYTLAGSFGPYDFAPIGDKSAFDWAFTTSNGKSYQLQGNAPSANDVFGWKEVNITPPAPAWYMFSLGDDVDGDGSQKFDWVLLSTNASNKSAYKLKGETTNGTFDYSGKLDIDYSINGNGIKTGAVGTLDEADENSCANGCTSIHSNNLAGYTLVTEYQSGTKVKNTQKVTLIFSSGNEVISVIDYFDGSRKVARGGYNNDPEDGAELAILSANYSNGDIYVDGIGGPNGLEEITVGQSHTAVNTIVTAIVKNENNGIDEQNVGDITIDSSSPVDENSPLSNASSITIYNNSSKTEIDKTVPTFEYSNHTRYDSNTPLHCIDYGFSSLLGETTKNGVHSLTYMESRGMCIEIDNENGPYPGNTNTAFYK